MKQLDPKAVWLFFINFSFRWFFVAIILGIYIIIQLATTDVFSNLSAGFPLLFGIMGAPLIFFYIWARLTFYYYRYELTAEGFKKELGVIFKHYTTIPYDRIQNVDIHRGIFDRFLGLSSLSIQTAGASAVVSRRGMVMRLGAEGFVPGLSHEIAEQLRSELIARARQTKPQGL